MVSTCAKLSHGFLGSVSFIICEILNPTAKVYRHFCLLSLTEIGNKSFKTCMIILVLQTLHSFSKVQKSKVKCSGNFLHTDRRVCHHVTRKQQEIRHLSLGSQEFINYLFHIIISWLNGAFILFAQK